MAAKNAKMSEEEEEEEQEQEQEQESYSYRRGYNDSKFCQILLYIVRS